MKVKVFKKASIIFTVYFMFSLTLLTACSGDNTINYSESKSIIRIGLSMDDLVIDRWQRDRDIFVAKAKELGAEVIVQNANEDSEKQINQIEGLIGQGIDVLVVIPYDKDDLTQVLKAAKKKGIKVVSYDRLVKNANVDVYISFDNVKVGKLMGQYLIKKVPVGNYLIINGSDLDNNSFMFNQGFKAALDQSINAGKIRIINEIWARGWREDIAYNGVEQKIKEGYKIDGIIGANDRLAEASIRALSEYGKAGDVEVVGHDADLSACQRIVEGTQLMTVYKPIKELAQGAAEIAVKLAKGESIETENLINDGTYDVPFKMYEPIPVTKDNMLETIINDDFHSFEDVYRNVPEDQRPAR